MASKKKAIVIEQTPIYTQITCPRCKKLITLWHEPKDEPNDGIGPLHAVGDQNFNYIVCMNRTDVYCGWAADVYF